MKIGDRVRLVSCHRNDDQALKSHVGEIGTIQTDPLPDQHILVRFDRHCALGGRFWIKPGWLELAPGTSPEWMRVVPIDDAELVFPVGDWQPEWSEIPDRYKNGTGSTRHEPSVRAGQDMFYGRRSETEFHGIARDPLLFVSGEPATAKDGWRMICVVLGSYRFPMEHKEALVGWAIDSVFKRFWFHGEQPDDIRLVNTDTEPEEIT